MEWKEGYMVVMEDGTMLTEDDVGWADVDLHKIVEIRVRRGSKEYKIAKKDLPPDFVEFIQYKTAVSYMGPQADQLLEQTIGYHNGTHEFLLQINAKTGLVNGQKVVPMTGLHLHPKSKVLIQGA